MGIKQCCKKKEIAEDNSQNTSTKVPTSKGQTYPTSTIIFQQLPSSEITDYFIGIDKAVIIGKGSGNPKDKYKFGKKIGEGAFGVVYMAQNIQTDALCAIKVLKRTNLEKTVDEETIKEIELLKGLDHPNIIKILEFYESPTHYFIVTEFCKGGELFSKLMEEGGQSEITSAIIMFQLFGAINYCHNFRIMHRDLKPENIMLEDKTRNGNLNIKLIDFGTAKFYDKNLEKQIIGTCYYIAPEVLSKQYNEKCDLWSCGVVLYILLKGKFPFGGQNQDQIFQNIKKGEYNLTNPPFDRVSNEAKDLIRKLLEKDVNKRISAAEGLEHPWFLQLKIKEKLTELSIEQINNVLKNICNYNPQKKLQQAAIAYLVHNNSQLEEIFEARCLFLKIDKNNDGLVPIKEFKEGLVCLFNEQGQNIEIDIDLLFKIIDADNSNNIEYEEFIRAGINKSKLLEEKLLRSAFGYFATQESKTEITLDHVKSRFKQNKDYPDEEFKKIIDEVDLNKDGVVDFNEFKIMMTKILD